MMCNYGEVHNTYQRRRVCDQKGNAISELSVIKKRPECTKSSLITFPKYRLFQLKSLKRL